MSRKRNSGRWSGFPSPARDYLEHDLDLNGHLIRNPAATFFVRMDGDSMIQAGIHPQDLLIVDRSRDPKQGSVVLATFQGEFLVRTIRFDGGPVRLCPAHPDFTEIPLSRESDFLVWGVVTHAIHALAP
jgi:DNA polymerase V